MKALLALDYPALITTRSKSPVARRLLFQPRQWEGRTEGALSSSAGAGFCKGATPRLCLLFILDLVSRVGLCTGHWGGMIPLLLEGHSPRWGGAWVKL